MEAKSFSEFGPLYFLYLDRVYSQALPSCLSKILGVFKVSHSHRQVSYTNSRGHRTKQYLMVMENLFYNQKVDRIFDLKGAEKNRISKVQPTDLRTARCCWTATCRSSAISAPSASPRSLPLTAGRQAGHPAELWERQSVPLIPQCHGLFAPRGCDRGRPNSPRRHYRLHEKVHLGQAA